MKLNVGCGNHPATGWVNLDLTQRADVIASVTALPFKDNALERAYAGHVLEHLELSAVLVALVEIRRVTKRLLVVGPDLNRAQQAHPDAVRGVVLGAGRWAGDEHRWPSRESTTRRLLEQTGWVATSIPIEAVSDEWPITSRVGWQFALYASHS